ncbi:MAG: 16S rRNA (guanine(966)-N(2))-methyltransferase RsmD [Clostridiales bacterium]|nr:16S rRNA (guanine(966)-N(2))-methyltransferase RsmD [Clostridiales bacterium]
MPRVVTGEFRGTILNAPKGDNTRPTTDKVKEAVFSMIQMRVPECSFLDIFSGTGQMGIEAVSRGAVEAVMIERSGAAAGIIKENLQKIHCGEDPRFRLIKAHYDKALEVLGQEGKKFDIIFLDPPYREAHKDMVRIAGLIRQYGLLSEGGIVLCEHSSDLPFDTDVINLKFIRSCSYGLTVITFFE